VVVVAKTQQERKTETRRLLLDAAATLFADHGIDAVSVDAVADAAGRTSGALYAHFGSKQGLLLSLMDEWSHSLVTVIAAEFELAPSIEDRLRAVATNVVTEPTVQTRRLMLLERELWLRAARDADVATAMTARAQTSHEHLARGLATWIRDGLIAPSSSPEVLASVLCALVVGLQTQNHVGAGAIDTDAAVAALAAVLGVASSNTATSGKATDAPVFVQSN
jgi:AcrR family transcriptional regulator